MGTQQKGSSKGQKKGSKKKGKMILLICEVLVLVVAVIALYFVFRSTGDETGVQHYEVDISTNPGVPPVDAPEFEKYTNIALFGVDARNGKLESGTRSDTIMILSINNESGECRLVSVYRDTYLNLGNDTYNKCNGAYAKGGPQQAINMLNMNLDLYIKIIQKI